MQTDRGWTRERLAKEVGIAVGTLSRLESEGAIQPAFFTVGAVAEALAVSLDDLFRTARVAPVTPGLWSAGYEGRDIESFVASLVDSRISVVADVRLTPISRKKGFSKTRLGGPWPKPASSTRTCVAWAIPRTIASPSGTAVSRWVGRVSVASCVPRRPRPTLLASQSMPRRRG
nr:helix-turn-helix domain-containing protein [Streptomyces sp. BpilaLS-43]